MAIRFYLSPDEWTTNELPHDEAKHAIKVLRLKTGAKIELFNGEGRLAKATITSIQNRSLFYEITQETQTAPPNTRISLYQSIPKGKNMELIIQKAVELGVSSIHPIITKNTVAISDDGEKKAKKWQRIAVEACKQCQQTWLPVVHAPIALSEIHSFTEEMKIVASLRAGSTPVKNVISQEKPPKDFAILVGPEGDFTPQELDHVEQQGFSPVTLGNLVLRVETATLFLMSAIRYEFLK